MITQKRLNNICKKLNLNPTKMTRDDLVMVARMKGYGRAVLIALVEASAGHLTTADYLAARRAREWFVI